MKAGHKFHLYTYDKVKNIPKGTIIKDANKIIPEKELKKLKGNHLPFSDIFRYKMLYDNGGYWVDLDMICIKKLDFSEPFVFSSERTIQKGAYARKEKFMPNIGILKAPKKSEFYKTLYERCLKEKEKPVKNKLKFMIILRKHIHDFNYSKYVKNPNYFCHLDWWYAKDAFYPQENNMFKMKYGVPGKSINSMFKGKNVYTVHFWRNLVLNKYKLDPNGTYHEKSLWERVKKFIN